MPKNRPLSIRYLAIRHLLLLSLLLSAPFSAFAQDAALDGAQQILNQPSIPMPSVDEEEIGNRKTIQEQMPSETLQQCELWEQQKEVRPKALAAMPKQKKALLEFIDKQRIYLNELYIRMRQALEDVENYKARQMDQAQIDLAQRIADALKKRVEYEQERLLQAQKSYRKIVVRQAYYVNLDDYFPECYDKYPDYPDPENVKYYREQVRAMKAQKSGQ